jgi:hypothetical protein
VAFGKGEGEVMLCQCTCAIAVAFFRNSLGKFGLDLVDLLDSNNLGLASLILEDEEEKGKVRK